MCVFSDWNGADTFRSKAHDLRAEKLMGLLRRRASVERKMMASAKKLESALGAANMELQVALEARIKDASGDMTYGARGRVS